MIIELAKRYYFHDNGDVNKFWNQFNESWKATVDCVTAADSVNSHSLLPMPRLCCINCIPSVDGTSLRRRWVSKQARKGDGVVIYLGRGFANG